jgi:hypothetical protein
MSIAEDCYNQGVADERKRCFDIANDRVTVCYKAAKIFPDTDYEKECATQAIEALLISQRIDMDAWRKEWTENEL